MLNVYIFRTFIIFKFFVAFVIQLVISQSIQHIAVIENDAYEQSLPSHFRNPFYKNHRIRAALADFSWFGEGETPVFERQADAISRSKIYSVLTHAGFIPRKPVK